MEKLKGSRLVVIILLLLILLPLRYFVAINGHFLRDQAWHTEHALKVLRGEDPIWVGASVTFEKPFVPGFAYSLLLIPPLLLGPNPLNIHFWLAILDLTITAILFIVIYRYWGFEAALAYTLVYAFSSYHIMYNKNVWNSNFAITFSGLFFAVTLVYVKTFKEKWWYLMVFLAVFLWQIHLATFMHTITPLALSLIVTKVRLRKLIKMLALAAIIVIIMYLPYLIWDMSNNWANTKELLKHKWFVNKAFAKTFLYMPIVLPSAEYWIFYITQGKLPTLSEIVQFSLYPLTYWKIVLLVLRSIILLGILWAFAVMVVEFFKKFKYSYDVKALSILYLTAPIGIILEFMFQGRPFYPHYIVAIFPFTLIPFILAAKRWVSKKHLYIPWAIIYIIATIMILFYFIIPENKSVNWFVQVKRTKQLYNILDGHNFKVVEPTYFAYMAVFEFISKEYFKYDLKGEPWPVIISQFDRSKFRLDVRYLGKIEGGLKVYKLLPSTS